MPTITLIWDPMPSSEAWKEVRIYEAGVKVATAIPPAISVSFAATKAQHTWVARSWDGTAPSADYNGESADSNPVTWAPPVPPGHLRR